MVAQESQCSRPVMLALILTLLVSASPLSLPIGAIVSPASASTSPIFSMTIIIPQGDPVKNAWCGLLAENLRQVGIECRLASPSIVDVYGRVLTPNSTYLGQTYDQGGFDAIALGYQLTLSSDPYLLYATGQFAPAGRNCYLWNDTYNDNLCSSIRSATDVTARLGFESAWQLYAMQVLPSTTVFYLNGTMIAVTALNSTSLGAFTYPVWPTVEQWSGDMTALAHNVTLAQLRNCSSLMPIFSTSYFDAAVMNPIYGPGGYGLFQPVSTSTPLTYVPCIAENETHTPDLRNWTINLRSGVLFHDSMPLTGRDVNFTLIAYMTPALGSPLYSTFAEAFGSNSSIYLSGDYTVEIRLPAPYAHIMDLLSVPILPEHILKQIPYDMWRTSPLNTGIPSSVQLLNGTYINLAGPVGAGPYRYVGYDNVTQTYSLQKFGSYFNKTALEGRGLFQFDNYLVRIIDNTASALTEFGYGRAQVLDTQYHFELLGSDLVAVITSYIQSYTGTTVPLNVIVFPSLILQELGFNMRHPVLGTGIDTPVGTSNSSKAAEAAAHVRKAISYAIQRQLIVEQLLSGYGVPGRTSAFCPGSEGYNSTMPFYEYDMGKVADELRLAGFEPVSLLPGFLETYGSLIAFLVLIAVIIVSVAIIRRTNILSRLRGQGLGRKKSGLGLIA